MTLGKKGKLKMIIPNGEKVINRLAVHESIAKEEKRVNSGKSNAYNKLNCIVV
jgi:hypothetical protein